VSVTFSGYRQLVAALLFLGGAALAVFVTGRHDVAAMAAVAGGAGLGLLVGRPTCWPGWVPLVLSLSFVAAAALSIWPVGSESLPEWRLNAPEAVSLAAAYAAMPAHVVFWWLVLAGTVAAGWLIVASPLDSSQLRVFLHVAAGVVAVYAVVSMAQAQTDWKFAFSGGANFGLLPNRNHTATLLVVGSIISFGLMQWEVARGHRVSAALAALCGAPSLAALLFFSTSRAGVVFLAFGFFLWAIGATGTAVKRRTTLATAGVLVVFLILLLVLGGSTVRDRLGKLWQDVIAMESAQDGGGVVDFRQPVFRDTLRMTQDAPLTGQGMGHFEFVFPHYRQDSLTGSRALHPESDWLMVAAESGWPSVVILLGLAGWYVWRSWSGRQADGGLLRWTAASAIGAALAHGIIDVPWHRPALGWFLLSVALVSVPPSGRSLRWPALWHSLQILLGLALLGGATYLAWSATTHRPPLAYRWAGYAAELKSLQEARKFDDGEFVAREAIADFPLHYQAYYWRAAFLRMFEGTNGEMKQDVAAGRFVEPVLPRVAAEQAQVWFGIDDELEAESRAEAVRRAARIENVSGVKGAAAGELDKGIRAAQERPAVEVALREQLQGDPVLLAYWTKSASSGAADQYLAGLGSAADSWLDALPLELRQQVLSRWVTLPSGTGAVAYMEARNDGAPTVYWRQLANYYAKAGDKERAVGMVAGVEGVMVGGALPDGAFSRQLAELEGQGNEVAVRRLVREAVAAPEADPERLRVAMVWFANTGDWEMAWKAASRLASARKNGQ
jgi:hypothetical protein